MYFLSSQFFNQWMHACTEVITSINTRTFWPALLTSWVVYLCYQGFCHTQWSWKRNLLDFLGYLTHPSSYMDLCLLLVRALVNVCFLLIFPWSATWLSVKIIYWGHIYWGTPHWNIPMPYLTLAYSLGLLLLSDLSRYLLHRCMHHYELLWRFHQVHHSAEVMTPFTLYRIHPVEQVMQKLRGMLVVGLCSGVFAWLSHGKASVWSLYGVPGVIVIFTFLGANLRHSHCWLPYPAWVEHYFISPAQHQQHHDCSTQHQRSNFGSMFAFWDYLGGTLRLSGEGKPQSFGLDKEDTQIQSRNLISLLLYPFKRNQ